MQPMLPLVCLRYPKLYICIIVTISNWIEIYALLIEFMILLHLLLITITLCAAIESLKIADANIAIFVTLVLAICSADQYIFAWL